MLDHPESVAYHLNEARAMLRRAHAVASEDGGLTGEVRDALFGINTFLDSFAELIGLGFKAPEWTTGVAGAADTAVSAQSEHRPPTGYVARADRNESDPAKISEISEAES